MLSKQFLFSCILVLICCASLFAQPGWISQQADLKGDLVAVYFTSSDKGWVAGDDGYLASTTDGGRTWTQYPLNTTENINEIYFRNEDNGYLVAGRKMFITRDAGRSWQDIRIYRSGEFGSAQPDFLSIRFSDKNRGYVIGSLFKRVGGEDIVVDSLLMRTEDGGDTWRRIALPTKVELFHLDFDGNQRGWIVGDEGVILASTDEGNTWIKQDSATKVSLFNVDFRDSKEGYVVGAAGVILRTTNGGASWEKVETNFTTTFLRVDFPDDKNGWVVGKAGNILRTIDKGKTWTRQEINTREHLYGLYMDKKYGWAVGEKGLILKYKK